APESLPSMPQPTAQGGDVAAKARAYLHSNCSHCHRPNGGGRGSMDFRFSNSFAQTKSCGVAPEAGNFRIAGGQVINPGHPEKSMVSLRVHATDSKRMPPLGTKVVDAKGATVLDDWITSLTACPAGGDAGN